MSHEQLNLEVVEIVRNWNDLAKRSHYERRLHELGPTAVETLLFMARQEVTTRKIRRRVGLFLFVLPFGLISLKHALFGKESGGIITALFYILRYTCLFAGLGCLFKNTSRAANVMADFDDLRIVGPLVESWRDIEARPAITDALLRLLPRMKASDSHLLNLEQRKALYKILKSDEETLLLAILKALEQIGDSAALPFVEKLANPPLGGKVSVKVKQAAWVCLPFLIERAKQEHNSATLLRASGTMETHTGELLRPATTTSETDPRDLLRATQQE
jgi:hypothetical protein